MVSRKKAIGMCIITALCALLVGAFAVLWQLGVLSPNPADQFQGIRLMGVVGSLVQSEFYQEVDVEAIYEAAAKGMMRSLDDPYAAYYTSEEYAKLSSQQQGVYEGIGVVIADNETGEASVVKVYDGTPAQKAGVQPGDVFVSVNGTSVSGMSLDEVKATIEEQMKNMMDVVFARDGELIRVSMVAEQITVHRVHFSMVGDVAHIIIDEFTGDCVKGFADAINMAQENGARALCIDLRSNPGGNLDDVVDIADMILGEGTVLTMRTRAGKETVYTSDKSKLDYPIAVLINGSSASASEVLAGALQDHDAAVIVGTQSFGKGIVQTVYPLQVEGGGRVKLTTATYYTPSGRCIHGVGITPDIEVALPESLSALTPVNLPEEEDTQLEAALNVLAQR